MKTNDNQRRQTKSKPKKIYSDSCVRESDLFIMYILGDKIYFTHPLRTPKPPQTHIVTRKIITRPKTHRLEYDYYIIIIRIGLKKNRMEIKSSYICRNKIPNVYTTKHSVGS